MPSDTNNGSSSTLVDLSTADVSINETIQMLDDLLKYGTVGGSTMSASEYSNLESHVSPFNEWDDDSEKLIIIGNNGELNESEDDEEEKDSEQSPPKLSEALEIIQQLRLYSICTMSLNSSSYN